MFKARPVSRVRARREALARDILGIHPDFLMAVYGYGKMHARPIAGVGIRTESDAAGAMECGMLPSTGTVGGSCGNAMAESVNGAYRTELVWRRKPFRDLGNLELATFQWVSWRNSKRPHRPPDHKTPQAVKTGYYANQAAQAASL